MFIHGKIAHTEANGPGVRSIVHFQGCTLACSGCWNPETWKFDASKETSIFELAEWILDQNVEGITFSGGEPFQQAPSLELLVGWLKEKRPDFSIGTYTGYTLREIRDGKFQWWNPSLGRMEQGDAKLAAAILKHMDFVIAGRYNEQKRTLDKPLCGSTNQEVHFLTTRYSAKDLRADNIVEVTIDKENGLVQITGFPEKVAEMDKGFAGDDGDLIAA